jgi:hypothetical protein
MSKGAMFGTEHVRCKLDDSVRLSMLALFLERIHIPNNPTKRREKLV